MVLIFAHRGAVSYAPENTLKAFEKALELGVDGIELDVRLTKDEKLVVIHDKKVNRTTNGSGLVSKMNLKELKNLNIKDGEKIPTLEEVIKLTKGKNCILNIELKTDGTVEKVHKLINQYGIGEKTIISSFKYKLLKESKKINEKVKTAALIIYPLKNPTKLVLNCYANSLHTPQESITKKLVDELHKHNLSIRTYALLNRKTSEKKFKKLIECGVDSIITNQPELYLQRIGGNNGETK